MHFYGEERDSSIPHNKEPDEVTLFMKKLPRDKKEIVQTLRAIIFDAIPDVNEMIKWKTLTYKRNDIIGMIMVFKNQVNLQLWHGADLSDNHGLVEGTGKGMRHVKFVSKADIKPGPVGDLLRQAAGVDAGKREG